MDRPRWHGHAVQLKRLTASGRIVLVFQGCSTTCRAYATSLRRKHNFIRAGLWIEDLAEPARVLKPAGSRRR